ncbi:MAG: twin-arginine translocase TatA/TatE family subunit [Nitrospirae bacterium]|jgi:sec-independent protein translocase protein TatA|uniref:Sec-independent protein translocase protein TatA n=1 Tax=Leptospirillum ferrodiazotrophum TaxID=412449 RepID=C6HUH3_9BACT|nr:MAG: twin-arginine translocation protein, TatA/E family subunit [Leptospirillum ferrodiazotrophum]MCL5953919.1 twin-arginine translocase TatA/TatE family subunit [Nitrospirota bacterium]
MLTGLFEPIHLIVILLIVMLVFGAKKLPEIGSGMGKAISNFKRSIKDNPDPPEPDDKLESKK